MAKLQVTLTGKEFAEAVAIYVVNKYPRIGPDVRVEFNADRSGFMSNYKFSAVVTKRE